jgi:hypothetical protein
MKRFLCLFLFLSFFLAAYVATAEGPAGKPEMVIEQEVYDAGSMYRTGSKIEHAFVIKNRGTSPLNIYSATPG